jgi:hypothetical protein
MKKISNAVVIVTAAMSMIDVQLTQHTIFRMRTFLTKIPDVVGVVCWDLKEITEPPLVCTPYADRSGYTWGSVPLDSDLSTVGCISDHSPDQEM